MNDLDRILIAICVVGVLNLLSLGINIVAVWYR